jgi:RNA polymerase sigma-70 factor (ECF subfamily)
VAPSPPPGIEAQPAAALVAWLDEHRARELAWIARALPVTVKSQLDPEDVLQEALARGVRRLHAPDALQDPADTDRWFRVLILRTIIDVLRSAGRTRRSSTAGRARARELADDEELLAQTPDRRAPGAAAFVEAAETADALDDALAALPAHQQRALTLVAIDGVSYQDAARELGIAPDAVRDHVRRAREKLEAQLEPGRRKLTRRSPEARRLGHS